jgi:hypothetical protein
MIEITKLHVLQAMAGVEDGVLIERIVKYSNAAQVLAEAEAHEAAQPRTTVNGESMTVEAAQKLFEQTAETHDWFYQHPQAMSCKCGADPAFAEGYTYTYTLKAPKLKPLDWSKMPAGVTLRTVNKKMLCTFIGMSGGLISAYSKTMGADDFRPNRFELAPAESQPWLYWGGGECPVPTGVTCQITFRSGETREPKVRMMNWQHENSHPGDIIAYRITGVASGYTDGGAV